jgi:hypothetical protein
MPWLLLLPAAGLFFWFASQRAAEDRLRQEGGGRMPWDHAPPRPLPRAPARRPGSSPNAADYLRHLNEACWASRMLDQVKPMALAADVASLMESPPEVAQALLVLCQPMEASFLQKDLNILGAEPPLAEDGRPSRAMTEAIKALQARFQIRPTGEADRHTVAAIRYSVGCIYSQDRAEYGAD